MRIYTTVTAQESGIEIRISQEVEVKQGVTTGDMARLLETLETTIRAWQASVSKR